MIPVKNTINCMKRICHSASVYGNNYENIANIFLVKWLINKLKHMSILPSRVLPEQIKEINSRLKLLNNDLSLFIG